MVNKRDMERAKRKEEVRKVTEMAEAKVMATRSHTVACVDKPTTLQCKAVGS
jgi:hypothetical protein